MNNEIGLDMKQLKQGARYENWKKDRKRKIDKIRLDLISLGFADIANQLRRQSIIQRLNERNESEVTK